MTRIRTDNVFGTVTDNPLTGVATTMNSAGLANLAAVSGSDEAIVVLDPNRAGGAPEIVVVTAHTGSATSATIARGQFGTVARQHNQGTEWVHGPIASNATSYATAANDQGDYVPIGTWQSYTPTLVQSAAVAKTVNHARFVRVGQLIVAQIDLAVTASGTTNNEVLVGLPVNIATDGAANRHLGAMLIYDASTTTRYQGAAEARSTSAVGLSISQASAGVWGTAPNLALASGDIIRLMLSYMAPT